MKKLMSLLVVLAMLMAIGPAVFAEDYPVGSIYNMAYLEMGENTCEVAANPDGEMEKDYFYVWMTEVAGTFTIDFADDSEGTPFCQIYVNNQPLDDVISEKGGAMTVELEAYSTVWLQVGEWNYQAATFTFTASFVEAGAEGGMAGSGTETDPWIVESLPVTLEGTFTEAEAADEEFMGHYYQFTATEAGTVSWTQWSNCGLFVTVNGAWSDADARDVVPGDVIVFNCFPFYAADYTANIEFEASAGEEGGDEPGEDVEGLFLGDNFFDVPEASSDGDVFVAPQDGTLVIAVTTMLIFDAELGEYVEVAPANHFGRMGNYVLVVDDVEQTGNVTSIEVVAGQEVSIYIATVFGAPAQAVVNLAMETNEQGGENDTPASGTVDVTADSPIVYELVLEADATVTITLTSTAGWEVHICNADESVDNRYWSDVNWSPITEELAAGVYTITIYGYDEISWDYIDATITYDISSGAEEGGDEPTCAHENAYLDYEYYEDDSGFDLVLICPDCNEVLERYAAGEHELNPLLLDFIFDEATNNASATVTVPAGQTLWVGAYRIGGMLLTINGVEYGLLMDAGPYSPVVITLTNDGTEDATYELVLSYPLGSSQNPDQMIMNETFQLEIAENSNGYVFEWIATADGTVTLVIEGENWIYFVTNYGDPDSWEDDQQSETFFAVYDGPNTYTFTVKAGDQIHFSFATQDVNWNFPAETLTITATFEGEGTEEGCAHENLVHMDAVEPGCHFNGNIEYWVCYDCECVWADEALTQVTNILSVVLPATGGEVVHFEAVEPGCHFEGNIEYWICYECQQVWQDEALTQLTNILSVVVPAVGGEVIHVEAKAPTCYEEGNIEHWYCETCEKVWQDEALTQLTNHMNVKLAPEHTNLVHMDAVAPGCHFEGNVEYWVCYDCGGVWTDEALTQVSNILSVVVPALGGEVVHVEAKAPTCTEEGNIEHWYCEECQQVWTDEALTQLTNHMSVKLGATGHTYVDGVCHCGAVDENPPTGDPVAIFCGLVAISSMGLAILPKKKEN